MLGIVNVQLNPPEAFVVVVQTVPPLELSWTAESPENPLPVNVTFAPVCPDAGLSLSAGSTVKVPAEVRPTESFAVNV